MGSSQPRPNLAQYQHGFRTINRLGRLAWGVVEGTLFRLGPAPVHWLRRWLLRAFGADIHPTAHGYPSARVWAQWNVTTNAHSCLSWGVDCNAVDRITLRRQAVVSQYARLITASRDISDPKVRLVHRPIEIGPIACICAYAYVGMGLTIGEGAVVAATATATKDVEPWTVVGGNPARPTGTRAVRTSSALELRGAH